MSRISSQILKVLSQTFHLSEARRTDSPLTLNAFLSDSEKIGSYIKWPISCFKITVIGKCSGIGIFFRYFFNPPLTWGEGRITPSLANFLNNFQTSTDIDAKLMVLYAASSWHIHTKCQRNPSDFFFRKWHFGDVMSCDLGSKNGQLSMASRM